MPYGPVPHCTRHSCELNQIKSNHMAIIQGKPTAFVGTLPAKAIGLQKPIAMA